MVAVSTERARVRLLAARNGGILHVEDSDFDNQLGRFEAGAGSRIDFVNARVRGGRSGSCDTLRQLTWYRTMIGGVLKWRPSVENA